ncbi:MAG: hypothetical protein NT049_03675, partial [Planctomycetota bacterium]|nr:hypothetical protein [Planctomycetota bacterium]
MKALGFLSLVILLILASYPASGAQKKPAPPPTPSPASSPQTMDAAACRDKALAAEKAQDLPGALESWERVIDRCPATEEQRVEA